MNGDIVNGTLQLPLDSDEFTRAIANRLRENDNRIKVNNIAIFCGLTTQAVSGWLKGATPPGGLITIKLAHLLQLIGVDSPELDLLQEEQPLNAFICRMLAFGTINIDEAQTICGGVGVQAVYKACRGSGILRPLYRRVRDFPPSYTDKLKDAIDLQRRVLGLTSTPAPSVEVVPTREEPAQPTQPTAEPVHTDPVDRAVQLSPGELDDLVVKLVAALRPQVGTNLVNSADTNSDRVVRVAEKLLSMLPAIIIAKEQFSDEERALLRKLMGEDTMFLMSTLFNQLCSTRAFSDGR